MVLLSWPSHERWQYASDRSAYFILCRRAVIAERTVLAEAIKLKLAFFSSDRHSSLSRGGQALR